MDISHIGAELYTVRDETARDFAGTVRAVAAMGYPAIEFGGYEGMSADEARRLFDEAGITAPALHIPYERLNSDPDGVIAYALTLGTETIVLPWVNEQWRTHQGMRMIGTFLNDFGRRCADQGLGVGYHNHDFEFQEIDGSLLLDTLTTTIDPALVTLELDVYWAAFAGHDPVSLIRQRGDQIRLLHLKDMAPDRTFTEVGSGTLAMPEIIAVAREVGVRWFFVENDAPQMPSLKSLQTSLAWLQSL